MEIQCKDPRKHYLTIIRSCQLTTSQIELLLQIINKPNYQDLIISFVLNYITQRGDKNLIIHTYFFLKFTNTQVQILARLISYFPLVFTGEILATLYQDSGYYADKQKQTSFSHHLLLQASNYQRQCLLSQSFQPDKYWMKFISTLKQFKQVQKINKKKPNNQLDIDQTQFKQQQLPYHVVQLEQLKLDAILCQLCYDVYYQKDLNQNVIMKNFLEKAYKPRFQAFIQQKIMYVCISGTWHLADTVADADSQPVQMILNDQKVYVHQGFLQVSQFIHDQLMILTPYLIANKHIDEVIFTGHSQGAAASFILQQMFIMRFPQLKTQCIGFGTPPFVSKGFILNSTQPNRTYINNNDCISRAGILYQYINEIRKAYPGFQTEQYSEFVEENYGYDDDFYTPGDIYWLKDNNIVPITRYGVFIQVDSFLNFKDHRLEYYIENIKKQISNIK